jgi:hypothetical protein
MAAFFLVIFYVAMEAAAFVVEVGFDALDLIP